MNNKITHEKENIKLKGNMKMEVQVMTSRRKKVLNGKCLEPQGTELDNWRTASSRQRKWLWKCSMGRLMVVYLENAKRNV